MRYLKEILSVVVVTLPLYTYQAIAQEKAHLQKPVLEQVVRVSPAYELTKEQRKFCDENNIDKYVWKYRDLFFKNLKDIREGKLTGTPLWDMLNVMDEEGIIPSKWDLSKLSQKYEMAENKIRDAFAISALAIIDGKPEYVPSPEGLMLLKKTGLLDVIDKLWEDWATPELREEIGVRRQPYGPLYTKKVADMLLGREGDGIGLPEIQYALERVPGYEDVGLRKTIGVINVYTYARLFDEMPQEYKFVKHPKYIPSKETLAALEAGLIEPKKISKAQPQ